MNDSTMPAMLGPCVGMVALTALVWVKLYVDRLGEMRRKHVDPQSLASASVKAEVLQKTAASDNFRNLFEVPVLFYVLCVAVTATGTATPALVTAGWAYVALRALHSLIHVTYNRVVHRFAAYAASTLLLFGMWVAFVLGFAGA
ncbi:MAG: hypothetical protein H6R27_297 [Proteobacteria bacterium]|nr:hypothetical protein [Pseudomonadota bacterium]